MRETLTRLGVSAALVSLLAVCALLNWHETGQVCGAVVIFGLLLAFLNNNIRGGVWRRG
jgi:hypothetical protein